MIVGSEARIREMCEGRAERVIVCGHTRWKAAQKLGLEKVPVHVARDLTPEQIRAYRIADNKTNELATWNLELLPLEIAMGVSLPSRRVVRVLNELVALHGRPSAVRVDNGPEFTAQPFVDWCAEHGVATHYIQPGKPDQNAYIERFNRSYRTEVLNAHLFESIAELRALTDAWLRVYNGERPHDSLGRVPPLTFLPRPSSAETSPIELSA